MKMVQLPALIILACLCAAPLANAKVGIQSSLKRAKSVLTADSRSLLQDYASCDYAAGDVCGEGQICDEGDGDVCRDSCSDYDSGDGCNEYSECDGDGTCVPSEGDNGCSDYATSDRCSSDKVCVDAVCVNPTPTPIPTPTPTQSSGIVLTLDESSIDPSSCKQSPIYQCTLAYRVAVTGMSFNIDSTNPSGACYSGSGQLTGNVARGSIGNFEFMASGPPNGPRNTIGVLVTSPDGTECVGTHSMTGGNIFATSGAQSILTKAVIFITVPIAAILAIFA